MKIIGFCGLPGSGKSTALDAIKNLGYILNMGDIIREEANKRGKIHTDIELGKIAKELRKKSGLGIIAQKCIEKIKDINQEIIFIDGLRSWEEIIVFRKQWKFPIIAITINEEKRFNHIKERARGDDPTTYQELLKRDKRETNFGLKKLIESADYEISNNSSLRDLREKTIKKIKEIIENY
ncbi:MAG: AAA family ATPase [Candidatus Lokiarchaeota archaeon]|nr:AAA family ATPase [Candidatus Lokiarchaeota archaeon]